MVEIIYSPIKEVVIGECVQYPSLEVLCGTITSYIGDTKRPITLNWSNEIAFSYIPLPATTEGLIKERMKGRIYWSSAIFSLMPDYKPKMKVGKLDVRIIKTLNPLLKQVSNWLKDRAEKVE